MASKEVEWMEVAYVVDVEILYEVEGDIVGFEKVDFRRV